MFTNEAKEKLNEALTLAIAGGAEEQPKTKKNARTRYFINSDLVAKIVRRPGYRL